MEKWNETGRPGIEELLAFYADAGVDAALDEEPANRFAPPTNRHISSPAEEPRDNRARRPSEQAASRAHPSGNGAGNAAPRSTGGIAVPDGGQIALARQLAATATSLDELKEQLGGFEGCNLKYTAKNLVFADGNPQAPIMFVGEAPGRDEDLEGLPFVGRSGQLLDRILAAIGLDRRSAYIANVIPWRPPGNRAPTPQETEICRPFIERQIELVAPKVLVTLGGSSVKTLLNTTEGVMRLRGNWKSYPVAPGTAIPTMPTLHPAYLLRNPAHKKFVWRDFLEIKTRLRTLTDQ